MSPRVLYENKENVKENFNNDEGSNQKIKNESYISIQNSDLIKSSPKSLSKRDLQMSNTEEGNVFSSISKYSNYLIRSPSISNASEVVNDQFTDRCYQFRDSTLTQQSAASIDRNNIDDQQSLSVRLRSLIFRKLINRVREHREKKRLRQLQELRIAEAYRGTRDIPRDLPPLPALLRDVNNVEKCVKLSRCQNKELPKLDTPTTNTFDLLQSNFTASNPMINSHGNLSFICEDSVSPETAPTSSCSPYSLYRHSSVSNPNGQTLITEEKATEFQFSTDDNAPLLDSPKKYVPYRQDHENPTLSQLPSRSSLSLCPAPICPSLDRLPPRQVVVLTPEMYSGMGPFFEPDEVMSDEETQYRRYSLRSGYDEFLNLLEGQSDEPFPRNLVKPLNAALNSVIRSSRPPRVPPTDLKSIGIGYNTATGPRTLEVRYNRGRLCPELLGPKRDLILRELFHERRLRQRRRLGFWFLRTFEPCSREAPDRKRHEWWEDRNPSRWNSKDAMLSVSHVFLGVRPILSPFGSSDKDQHLCRSRSDPTSDSLFHRSESFSWDLLRADDINHHTHQDSSDHLTQPSLSTPFSSRSLSIDSDDSFVIVTSSPLQSPRQFESNEPPYSSPLTRLPILKQFSYFPNFDCESEMGHQGQHQSNRNRNSDGGSFFERLGHLFDSDSDESSFFRASNVLAGSFQTFQNRTTPSSSVDPSDKDENSEEGKNTTFSVLPTCTPLGCVPMHWGNYYNGIPSSERETGHKLGPEHHSYCKTNDGDNKEDPMIESKQLKVQRHDLDLSDYC